jgi:pentatricopeptide repeat protein
LCFLTHNLPTSLVCQQAIDAWAKSGATGGAERAQNIHDGMIALHKQTGDELIAPSAISYNAVMNAWGRCADPSALLKAEKVLQDMIEWEGNEVRPDVVSFSTLMDTYARSRSPRAIKRAEELFAMMVELGVKRNVYTFLALQNVYARSGRSDAPAKTLGILHRMLDLYSNGDVFAKPNCATYNAVLGAYSRTPSKESTLLSNDMLGRMELPVGEGGYDVEPDRLSYALTILACSRCPDSTYGAGIAEENLKKMETRAKLEAQKRKEVSSAAPPPVTLDLECFNTVLTALSKSRNPDAVSRMFQIVKRMERYTEEGHAQVRPTVRSWNAVLNGLSRSKEKNVGEKAEQVLNQLFDLHRKGVPDSKPDAFSFAAVLSAHQRSGNFFAAERADEIVRRMEELYNNGDLDKPPDVYHYTIVAAAWSKSKQKTSAQRCVQILSHMKERHQAGYPGVKPNVRTYNAVLASLARSNEAEKAEQLLYHMLALAKNGDEGTNPDSFSFNAVINAFTRSTMRDAGKRAESVLDRFLEHSEEFPKVQPDARSFTNIIAHYFRCKGLLDAPYRAEYVLNRLVSLYKSGHKYLSPNVFAVTTVIDTYAQHEHPDAGECAERLLRLIRKLRDDFGANELEVNSSVMNSVLNAWASCGDDNAGRRADALLQEMEEKFDDGCAELKPNARSYCLVLSAWSKSGSQNKAEKALEILNRMQKRYAAGKLYARPGEHPHSLVINACAFSNCSPAFEIAAFKIAVDVMTKMTKTDHLSPSSVTFGWFIQACGRLRVPDQIREENLERAFKSCCQRGLVNEFVLMRLKGSARESLFKRLVAPAIKNIDDYDETKDDLKEKILISHLPRDWTTRKQDFKRSISKGFSGGK